LPLNFLIELDRPEKRLPWSVTAIAGIFCSLEKAMSASGRIRAIQTVLFGDGDGQKIGGRCIAGKINIFQWFLVEF
jgi:hypothetical protein